MVKVHVKAVAALSLVSVLIYWKILLTDQYSLLNGWEVVRQAYSWYTFIARSIQQGFWPIWDPYTFSGRSFVGEMQTAAFYPLNFLLAAVPFNSHGLFSPAFYHVLYAATHVLGAYFMFALVRSLGLSFFAALLSGICFSFGGIMARLGGWPHLLQSGIWLPLVCLLAMKALGATTSARALAFSILAGLSLGLSILAGGLHLVMMQAIVVITASLAFAGGRWRERWRRGVLVACVTLTMGALSGAVQLLPSTEYSHLAIRWVTGGSVPATEKLSYIRMDQGLLPNAFFGLLLGGGAGPLASGEYHSPYLGVLPLLLAGLGIWKCWANPWVRYLTVLAGAAYLYSLGPFSLLHGIAYALVPFLWLAHEPGRFLYLADFSLAVLAGFGLDRLLAADSGDFTWRSLKGALRWVVGACIFAMAVPAIFGKPEVNAWVSFSLLMVMLSCVLVLLMLHGHRGPWSRFLVLALVVFDLGAFDWSATNRVLEASRGADHFGRLLSFESAAKFLKSKEGLFRVHMLADSAPNIGDAYGVPTIWGAGAAIPVNYDRIWQSQDLLGVRYVVRSASASEPGAVYQDRFWKIYENPTAYPRAWLVHETAVGAASFDPRKVALVTRPLDAPLDPVADPAGESVVINRYEPRKIELTVKTRGRALLVLSEVFYPGWRATVNAQSTGIVEVDRALRGIPVPKGESRVVLSYAPRSVYAGAALTLASFCTLPFALAWLWRNKRDLRRTHVS